MNQILTQMNPSISGQILGLVFLVLAISLPFLILRYFMKLSAQRTQEMKRISRELKEIKEAVQSRDEQ